PLALQSAYEDTSPLRYRSVTAMRLQFVAVPRDFETRRVSAHTSTVILATALTLESPTCAKSVAGCPAASLPELFPTPGLIAFLLTVVKIVHSLHYYPSIRPYRQITLPNDAHSLHFLQDSLDIGTLAAYPCPRPELTV